jgi:hypothetical protein
VIIVRFTAGTMPGSKTAVDMVGMAKYILVRLLLSRVTYVSPSSLSSLLLQQLQQLHCALASSIKHHLGGCVSVA